jgi:signal transduction histidine kinase
MRSFARGDVEQPIEFDVNCEIKTVARMAKSVVQRRGSELEVDLGTLPQVRGRPRQLMQVVMNLVVNAAQANKAGGKVMVTTRSARDEVAIEVRDTGIGMSSETVSKLFQPFFTTKPVGEGTGLGLAVVHGIVTGMGGRIDVQSELGKGSSFTVRLPCATRSAPLLRVA